MLLIISCQQREFHHLIWPLTPHLILRVSSPNSHACRWWLLDRFMHQGAEEPGEKKHARRHTDLGIVSYIEKSAKLINAQHICACMHMYPVSHQWLVENLPYAYFNFLRQPSLCIFIHLVYLYIYQIYNLHRSEPAHAIIF